ncbi:interleukin 17-like protein [Mya arenaria]|uniref:interleukin 17-like protein n=1 Tax=Mya arenaria TaxID=6604 RepID=UPI0022E48D77|nr:interleukin 17-like protein [Mya arenaria]
MQVDVLAVLGCLLVLIVISLSESCKEPSEETLREILYNSTKDETFFPSYLFPQIPGTDIDTMNGEGGRQKIAFWYGKRKCKRRQKKSGIEFMDISTCPWYLMITHDEERFPRTLGTARCRCKKCYNDAHEQPKDVTNSTCKEVFITQPVLRKNHAYSNGNKECTYTRSNERIAVGCTCVFVRTVKSEKIINGKPKS